MAANPKILALARVGDRNFAHRAADLTSYVGVIRLLKAAGTSEDGPVTHWYGAPEADPDFLELVPVVMQAAYPEATVTVDAAGNVRCEDATGLLACFGPFEGPNPSTGLWETTQSPTQFLTACDVVPIEGSLGGDQPGDSALAAAKASEPFVMNPLDALDPEVAAALKARLDAAVLAVLPEGAEFEMSAKFKVGLSVAQAMVAKYGN